MNCSDIAEVLDNRNVEQLGAAERQDVEAHLAACPECARDWELYSAFCALTDMREPSSFMANCRALVMAGSSSVHSQRMRSRLVLIGVFAAIAAAAGMLVIALQEPELTPLAAMQEPVAPAPMGEEAAPRIVVPEERNPVVTEPSPVEAAVPLSEAEKFTVFVLPVNYAGKDSASGAIVLRASDKEMDAATRTTLNALQAAVISELRALPGLTLIDADAAGFAQVPPADYEVRINGGAGTRGKVYSASIFGYKLGPEGKVQTGVGTVTGGAASCPAVATSKPVFCDDPASTATRAVNLLRTGLFPFDAAAQRLVQATVVDRRLPVAERVRALTVFATRADIASKKGAVLDPAVVRGAIELATSNADEAQRAHVWRTIRGVRHPDLIQPLITAAKQGTDREVQQEAVVTLGTFASDAHVRDELQTIARTDPRPLIRALAQRGLSGESYWNEYVSASLKDTSRTDAERIEAFMYHAIKTGPTVGSVKSATPQALRDVLDEGSIQAIAVLLPRVSAPKGPDRVRTGQVLINVAPIIDHPAISKMVLDNLANGADRSLWMSVAGVIVSFRGNNPELRAALEKIAAEDASPEWRKEAERVLQTPDPVPRPPAIEF